MFLESTLIWASHFSLPFTHDTCYCSRRHRSMETANNKTAIISTASSITQSQGHAVRTVARNNTAPRNNNTNVVTHPFVAGGPPLRAPFFRVLLAAVHVISGGEVHGAAQIGSVLVVFQRALTCTRRVCLCVELARGGTS